jgi:hypothetical protein
MLRASLYITVCSARNRLRTRLRRLREPRYLVGAAVGAAYLYFTIFARMRTSTRVSRRRTRVPQTPEALQALYASGPAITGLGLLALTAASWLVPFDSGLLDFSPAEIEFLFPAPVPRRQLLVHRMLRSQLGMLFTSLIVGVASPTGGIRRLQVVLGMWVLLTTLKVYFTGVSLSRARLAAATEQARRVARLPMLVIAAATIIVGRAGYTAWLAQQPSTMQGWLSLVGTISITGASRVVLWPFAALTRPLFAAWPGPFAGALGQAILVLAAVVAWVLASDGAFQDAAAEVSERRDSAASAAKRAGFKARATGLTLALTGRPELAFAWKAAQQTLRIVDRRSLLRIAVIVPALSVMAVSMGKAAGVAATLGIFAGFGAGFAILMAPQALRIDLRQDLQHLEVLKTWPVAPAAVVRGELLWPGGLLTGLAWACLAVGLFLSSAVFDHAGLPVRASIAAAVAIVAPALIFAQIAIHNGVALLFPAWVSLGSQRSRGLDAMGQRLILLGGTWLLLVLMTIPGALAGGAIWFAFRRLIAAGVYVPAALACAAIIGLEVLILSEAMGPAYERLDLTAVEPAE